MAGNNGGLTPFKNLDEFLAAKKREAAKLETARAEIRSADANVTIFGAQRMTKEFADAFSELRNLEALGTAIQEYQYARRRIENFGQIPENFK